MLRNANLITIGQVDGNSGKGSPLFSNQGKMASLNFAVFNKPVLPSEPVPPAEPLKYPEIKEEFSEIKAKKKFETVLAKFEKNERRVA